MGWLRLGLLLLAKVAVEDLAVLWQRRQRPGALVTSMVSAEGPGSQLLVCT